MKRVALDFETHYTGEYSVKKLGHALYARDPRFRCTMAAAWSPTLKVSTTPDRFPWDALDGAEIVAHNAAFDRAVFRRLQSDGIVPACIKPKIWLDSAAACAYFGLPRDLAGAVKALFGVVLDKSIRDRMMGVQGDLFDDVALYAITDAEWSWRLWERLGHKWPEAERRIHALTDEMGDRGVCLDLPAAKAADAKLAAAIAGLESSLPFYPPGSVPALKQACAEAGEPVPPGTSSKDPAVSKWCRDNQKSASPLWVRHVQAWRKANRTRKVVQAMIRRVNPETGRMAYQLKYFGAAQTGRWSGGGGWNAQNLNRRAGEQGVDLRGLIVPAPGHAFIIADFAQIEARVLLWLAGDYDFLDQLRQCGDIYEATARQMLGYTDPRPLKDVDRGLRDLAKPIRLGLQYNMRAKTLQFTALRDYGLEIPLADCERYEADFRAANKMTVDFWGRLVEAFAARHGKPWYAMHLPSGRAIYYWEPEAEDGWKLSASAVKGEERYPYHAGTLAENIASGTSRDILSLAAVRCADAGYLPVLSVHDELVFEVPEQEAERAKREVTRIMQTPPPWPLADRLPLEVEAHVAKRYGK